MNKLYEYKKQLPHTPHSRGTEKTLIIDGEQSFIDSYITKEEFRNLFGGYLITQNSDNSSDGLQYRGVWGNDKVRKFKQILSEHGVQFEICKIDGSQRIIKATANI